MRDAPSLEELFLFAREAELRVRSLRMTIIERSMNAKGDDMVRHEVYVRHPGLARMTSSRSDEPLSNDYDIWIGDGDRIRTFSARHKLASVRTRPAGVVGLDSPDLPPYARGREPLTHLPPGSMADAFIHPHGLFRNVLVSGPLAIVGSRMVHGREAIVVRGEHPRSTLVLLDRPDRTVEVGIDRATGFVSWLVEQIGESVTHQVEMLRSSSTVTSRTRRSSCTSPPTFGCSTERTAHGTIADADAHGQAASPRMIAYHDDEWGQPLHDERRLFEMLCLEGAQAGLSWATVLRRREGYRMAYGGFDAARMAAYDEARQAELLADTRIIRNRAKVRAFRDNARAVLALRERHGGLSEYVWAFVGGEPIVNHYRAPEQMPSQTPRSEALSEGLRAQRFSLRRAGHRVRVHAVGRPCQRPHRGLLPTWLG